MKENRKDREPSFLNNMVWSFNISWIMAGSIIAGFLIGIGFSKIFEVEWLTIIFAFLGALGGMWSVWKYYKKQL